MANFVTLTRKASVVLDETWNADPREFHINESGRIEVGLISTVTYRKFGILYRALPVGNYATWNTFLTNYQTAWTTWTHPDSAATWNVIVAPGGWRKTRTPGSFDRFNLSVTLIGYL